jgi:hypothetical protein
MVKCIELGNKWMVVSVSEVVMRMDKKERRREERCIDSEGGSR